MGIQLVFISNSCFALVELIYFKERFANCNFSYQSLEIGAGISIVDEGQPSYLVSLYITLDRQSSLLLFLSASPHLWQLETMLQ